MDINYLIALQNFREATGGIFNSFFELITKFGETSVLMLIIGLVYWCLDKRRGIFLMFAFSANRIINGFVKITACVYRPWIKDPRIIPVAAAQADATGYSFPSGHTGNAVCFWGGLSVDANRSSKLAKALIIGCAVLFLTAELIKITDSHTNIDIFITIGGIALCVILIIYASLKSYPIDYNADGSVVVEGAKMAVDSYKNAGIGMGFFIGWLIERRFVNFSTDVSIKEKIVRLVFCMLTYMLLDNLSGALADVIVNIGLSSGFAKAFTEFICMLYFTAGAPAISKLFSPLFAKSAI